METYQEWQSNNSQNLTNDPWTSLTNIGTDNNSAPRSSSRHLTVDNSDNLIDCSDGGIYVKILVRHGSVPTDNPMHDSRWINMNGNLMISEIVSISCAVI